MERELEFPELVDPTPTPTRLQMIATVGRVVHFVVADPSAGADYRPLCRAAVVTEATDRPDGMMYLAVYERAGLFFTHGMFDPAGGFMTWHWPERA
jgi:hypothetical protein